MNRTRELGGHIDMMTAKTIAIDDPELLAQAEKVARDEGVSIDQLAAEGLRREIGRRPLAN